MYSSINKSYHNNILEKTEIIETYTVYQPKVWNTNKNLQHSHNCYAYMLDDISQDLINLYKNGGCKKTGASSRIFLK